MKYFISAAVGLLCSHASYFLMRAGEICINLFFTIPVRNISGSKKATIFRLNLRQFVLLYSHFCICVDW